MLGDATIAGIKVWLGVSVVLAVTVSLFFAWMPLIGTAIGVYGAVTAWGLSWLMAAVIFFGPLAVALVLTLLGSLMDGGARKAKRS